MVKKSLLAKAVARAQSQFKLEAPLVVHHEDEVDPASGRTTHHFIVTSVSDPNLVAHAIALDEKGRPTKRAAPQAASRPDADLHALAGRVRRTIAAATITIQPDTNVLTLNPGDTVGETLVVKVPGNAAPVKADVYILADTTGSMGSILSAVQAGANSILTTLAGLGVDLAFGVGNYKDFLGGDPFAFQHQLAPTLNAPDVVAAITAWSALGGGDLPEAAFFALHSLAEPASGSIGWRSAARRIIVWFGDAPSHDPICAAASGLGVAITEASVTARLQAEGIAVLAISTKNPGLDDDPKSGATDYQSQCGVPGGAAGQATRIAAATGGQFVTGIDATAIVDTIIDLISSAIGQINNLKLVPSASIAPFVSSLSPVAGYGPLASDRDHSLDFKLVMTGIPCRPEAQHVTGTIDVVADGTVVAQKAVQITVPPCAPKGFVYSVKFVCGTRDACACECAPVQPGRYATSIAIHNDTSREVEIVKRFVPVVLAGAPAGREPRAALLRTEDRIVLPAHTATLDDCCRITELLFGAPVSGQNGLSIGFVELTASAQVSVTAIYTTGPTGGPDGADSNAPSISVEAIRGWRG